MVNLPVTLSMPSATPVTVDWSTVDTGAAGVATAGVDYVAASGTVTFAPGETSQTIPITVFGDTISEPPALYGEWGLVRSRIRRPTPRSTNNFFGLGVFVIVDDD